MDINANNRKPNRIIYLIMEYCPGGDLHAAINAKKNKHETFAEPVVRSYFYQMADGLAFIHNMKIMHRDLKPENILFGAQESLKIADFGVGAALVRSISVRKNTVGSIQYMAPEVMKEDEYKYPCDVWSLGVIIWEMITLEPPFKAVHIAALLNQILNSPPTPLPNNWNSDIRALLNKILSKDPVSRPTCQDILQEEFFKAELKTSEDSSMEAEEIEILSVEVWSAAETGNLVQLKNLLSTVAGQRHKRQILSFLMSDDRSQSMNSLHIASKNGHDSIVEYIVSLHCVDIDSRGSVYLEDVKTLMEKATSFWIASCYAQFNVMEILIKYGAEINAKTERGSSPLRAACFNGDMRIIRLLVENGADVNSQHSEQGTPFMLAVFKGHKEAVSYLLEHGANINARDKTGETCVHYAIDGNREETLNVLLKSVTDEKKAILINEKSEKGVTGLMLALRKLEGFTEIISFAKNRGLEIESADASGLTLLHYAIDGQREDIINFMWKQLTQTQRANWISLRTTKKETLLMFACKRELPKFVSVLLTHEADIRASDENGYTAFHWAAIANSWESMEALLGHCKRPKSVSTLLTQSLLALTLTNPENKKVNISEIANMVSSDGNTFVTIVVATARYIEKAFSCKPVNRRMEDLLKRNGINTAVEVTDSMVTKEMKEFMMQFIYLTRGLDRGRQAWHYVKIWNKRLREYIEKTRSGTLTVDVAEYGDILFSGWGNDPPEEKKSADITSVQLSQCLFRNEWYWIISKY